MAPLIVASDLSGYPVDEATIAATLASATVRNYCQWHISPSATDTLVLDGNGSTLLPLPTLYLTALELAEVDDVDVLADLEWSERGILRRAAGWPVKFRAVRVRIVHGYADVPDDVKAVAISAATRQLVNPEQVRSEAILGYSVTHTIPGTGEAMALALNRPERAILDRYRLPPTP